MRGLRGVGSGRMWAKLSGTAQLRGGASVPQRAHRRQSAQSSLGHRLAAPAAGRTGAGRHAALAAVSRLDQQRALRRAILVDNPGAALRFSVRLNLCIHATLGDLEALNLLRGGKVRRQQLRHTDDGALRKIARRAQCNFGPLRNLARSEEFTRTSKVTPSR